MTEVGIGLMLLVFAVGTYFSYREPENVGGAGQGWKPSGVMIQACSPGLKPKPLDICRETGVMRNSSE
jgi:hypothetical protein